MFHTEYDLTHKKMVGAQGAHLDLYVDAPNKTISGNVKITQAVAHPPDLSGKVRGWYVENDNGEIIATLMSDEAPRPGALAFSAVMDVRHWGDKGGAGFKYSAGTPEYDSGWVEAQPAEVAASSKS